MQNLRIDIHHPENRIAEKQRDGRSQQTDTADDHHRYQTELIAFIPVLCPQTLGQHDGGRHTEHVYRNDNNIHNLVAIDNRRHRRLGIPADHDLVNISDKEL